MRVSLIKNDKITDIILPKKIKGNYWVTDTDEQGNNKNIICIEADKDKWKLVSNNDVYYTINNDFVPHTILEPFNFYVLKNATKNSAMILYCSLVKDNTFVSYKFPKEKEILIGRSNDCDVIYDSINLSDIHASITYSENNYYLNPKSVVYINNLLVRESTIIRNGDIIFIMGLKIILENVDGNIIFKINNPLNMVSVKFNAYNQTFSSNSSYTESDEELDILLYNEDDNFHKKPRFIRKIETLVINLDSPPAKMQEDDRPWILTVGPMFTMSMMSMTSIFSAINTMTGSDGSFKKSIPSLLVSSAMLCGTFLWPSISKKYENKKREKREKERQEKYKKYVDDKRNVIKEEILKQRNILIDNFPSTSECENIILSKMTRLWERRVNDDDFLTVNLGSGNVDMDIDIRYPEDHFSMDEDNLMNIVKELGNEKKVIENAPISISLKENYLFGIVGNKVQTSQFMKELILQLIAFHSYDDLKIILLTNKDKEDNWKYLKMLPHLFSNDKSIRFFGTNSDEYKEIFYYLDKEYADRLNNENKISSVVPHYLLITDSFKTIRNFDTIKNILANSENLGFSLVLLTEKITNIPDQCKSFVNMYQDKGELYLNSVNNKTQTFEIDTKQKFKYYECVKILSNIHIDVNYDNDVQMPNKVGFLEMYDVGKIEQLNAPNRWKKNNPMLSLAVPVGIGKSNEKIIIDLHEKFHGPHGLVAGMTGSGKSEFLITYIISMAINFHPYEVQFILIDYKGGGLAGAFENNSLGLKLPHLVGTITNLDVNEIKRSLSSIESELKRRQKLFNLAREKSNDSTIDIYKYQKMYRDGIVDEPVSHLFIISDEFAELKVQQPEFMGQLISAARIGRSLGIHLILATQKPSGVVDPQIWSNTRFRICLRVQERNDSSEVIKRPDAAFLKQTGRFYFQVGFDEIFAIGQAAWCGGQYFPSETIRKEIDSSINFIDNLGNVIKTIETKKKKELGISQGEELINLVKYLDHVAKEEKVLTKPLWLEKIPAIIYVNNLINKYNYKKENFVIEPIIGEYDVPSMQQQHLLTLPISRVGNALIYGATGSGKENLITTILYYSMISYTPAEVNYYLIDFGTEALNSFENAPIIGDIIHIDDSEKVSNLYKMFSSIIDIRKKLFRDYNGEYDTYCKKSGSTLPRIILIINNFEAYHETYEECDDILTILSRDGSKYGINFIFTVNTPNGVRFKLKQNFTHEYVLQQNNDDDYNSILGNVRKNYPSKIFGRGIIRKEDIYEFQTAMVCDKDKIQEFIKQLSLKQSEVMKEKAKSIPILPNIVTLDSIRSDLLKDNNIIIGIAKQNLETIKYDFKKDLINIISCNDINYSYNIIKPLINQLLYQSYSDITFIDADDDFDLSDDYSKYVNYVNNGLDNYFNSLYDYVKENNELYINNNYSRSIFKNTRRKTIIILGYDAFFNRLSADNKKRISEIYEKAKDLGIINYIFIDSIDKLKKLEIEMWFKSCANTTDGIWIGPGINEQFTLKLSQRTPELKESINEEFCFVIKRGKPLLVKYVSKFDINIK